MYLAAVGLKPLLTPKANTQAFLRDLYMRGQAKTLSRASGQHMNSFKKTYTNIKKTKNRNQELESVE